MNCPHCKKHIANPISAAGGKASKRVISKEAQEKMQNMRKWKTLIKRDIQAHLECGYYEGDLIAFVEVLKNRIPYWSEFDVDLEFIDGPPCRIDIIKMQKARKVKNEMQKVQCRHN